MAMEPHLRILVTPKCNLSCKFCRLSGEGYSNNQANLMAVDEIEYLVRCGVNVGFTQVKITGGEALLREDILEIVKKLANVKGIENLNLGSNGLLVSKYAETLKKAGLDSITISLNTLNKKIYKNLTGSTEVDKVIEGIHKCQELKLPTIINIVVMKSNKKEIPDLLKLAGTAGATTKLMELDNICGFEYWNKEYLSLNEIDEYLRKNSTEETIVMPWSGMGIPMKKFLLKNGAKVLSMNPRNGVYYASSCMSCCNYPCQDGIFALRIAHDGRLKDCFYNVDPKYPNVLQLLRSGKEAEVRKTLKDCFVKLSHAELKKEWTPNVEMKRWKKTK